MKCSQYFLICFAIILSYIAFTIFPFLGVMTFIWFLLIGFIDYLNKPKLLSLKGKKIWRISSYLYPILEGGIKYMLIFNLIPYSWNWLNRIEHFISAVAITLLLYPLFIKTIEKLNKVESLILLIGVTVFIGNLNEFLEYFLRIRMGLTEQWRFSAYYWDTIFDLGVNVFGALVGGLVGLRLLREK